MNSSVKTKTKNNTEVMPIQEKTVSIKTKKLSDLKAEIELVRNNLDIKTLQFTKLQTKTKQIEKENQKLTEINELITNANDKNVNLVDVIKMYIQKSKGIDSLKSKTDQDLTTLRKQLDILESSNGKLEKQLEKERKQNQNLEVQYRCTVENQNARYHKLFENYQKAIKEYLSESDNFLKGFGCHI
ncbi:hypothetical protein FQR65_LT06437 [Abscondita terminalis]|nr:hypothetical protein FQR65_LT06437 [Abscondita terminalis]